MKKFLISLLLIPIAGFSQNLYNYGFSGTTSNLTTAGWVLTNQSTPTSATLWSVASYIPVVIDAAATPPVNNLSFGTVVLPEGATCPPPYGQAGGENSFTLVNFTSTTGAGTISNWMISPVVTVKNGDVVSFFARLGKIPGSPGSQFPDRLQLRMSTTGASTVNPSTGSAGLGSFTTLLFDVNPTLVVNVFPQVWTQYTATISGLPNDTAVKFGFRYFVTNGGPSGANSDIMGVDIFSVDRTLGTENFFKTNFAVYPNPATDVINISNVNKLEITSAEITDINGRIIKNIKSGVESINISDLNTGVYFLRISIDSGEGVTKIVKN